MSEFPGGNDDSEEKDEEGLIIPFETPVVPEPPPMIGKLVRPQKKVGPPVVTGESTIPNKVADKARAAIKKHGDTMSRFEN